MTKKKIFVAGHNGMVGSAICRLLKKNKNIHILTKEKKELNLTNQQQVLDFFKKEIPDEVIIAAAKVGGIHANNTYPAEFIYQNLQIQNNLINSSYLTNIKKLLFLGSSCIYPKLVNQPMDEKSLLTSTLEPTNEPYAIAKIAGIKMCESYNRQYNCDYRSVMPTNLYGPGDNYHPENSHVVPALIRRFHDAKINRKNEIIVWGTGTPKREFLFVDDLAEAALFIHNLEKNIYQKVTSPMLSHINIGTGKDITIKELAETIKKVVNYKGILKFDSSKPDGTPRKLLNVDLLKSLGWEANTKLYEGLNISYEDYKKQNS